MRRNRGVLPPHLRARLSRRIRKHVPRRSRLRNADTPETGSGKIKTCLQRSRSARCRTIPLSGGLARNGSSNCASGCSIFQICLRNSSFRC